MAVFTGCKTAQSDRRVKFLHRTLLRLLSIPGWAQFIRRRGVGTAQSGGALAAKHRAKHSNRRMQPSPRQTSSPQKAGLRHPSSVDSIKSATAVIGDRRKQVAGQGLRRGKGGARSTVRRRRSRLSLRRRTTRRKKTTKATKNVEKAVETFSYSRKRR
jgi:hypothetical protein